jgi:hypothetical protein
MRTGDHCQFKGSLGHFFCEAAPHLKPKPFHRPVNIRRKTCQTYSAEEKIRIVLAGLRGEESISLLSQKVPTTDTPKPECLTNYCRRRDLQCS